MIIYKNNDTLLFEFKNEVITLLNGINKDKKIVIFGTGAQSERFIKYFNINVAYFVDNSPSKIGIEINERAVHSPKVLKNDMDNILILIASEAHIEIAKQLNDMGFAENKDFFEILYFFHKLHEKAILEYAACDDYEFDEKNGPRILFDITFMATRGSVGGIGRFASDLITEIYTKENKLFVPVKQVGNTLIEPTEWLAENRIIHKEMSDCKKINFVAGDIWFLAGIPSNANDFSEEIIKIAKTKGVRIINCVHDIIPIKHPETCTSRFLNVFKRMFDMILRHSDGIITDSKSSADEMIDYIRENDISFNRKFTIGWFHCGCNLTNTKPEKPIGQEIREIFNGKTFLMVGTIEPRKGHTIALDAFEKLWDLGYNHRLCIAGKVGWEMNQFRDRLKNHKELNKRLFFLDTPTDDELICCYQNAAALIFASKAEGFGIPLIEAAQFHLPLIISDIPVFREIAGDYALYFDVFDSESLKEKIIEWGTIDKTSLALLSSEIHVQTWRDTFNQIISNIVDEQWYKQYN